MKRTLLFTTLLFLTGWLAPIASAQRAELGAYGDYLHLSQTDNNLAGVGGRLGFNVAPALMLEAQMSYDFERTFTEGFNSTGIGQIGTARSDVQVLQGLFGPKVQSHGPVKIFLTLKGGFIHFNLGAESANFPGAISSIENLRANNVSGMLYPGGGLEASLGPIGLRLDVGDDIYFNSGAHHNLSVSFGPVIHF